MSKLKIALEQKNPIPNHLIGFGTDVNDFLEIIADTINLQVKANSLQDDYAIEQAQLILEEYFLKNFYEYVDVLIVVEKEKAEFQSIIF